MSTKVKKGHLFMAGVEGFNTWKQQSIANELDNIVKETMESYNLQNINFEKSLQHMAKMRQFLSNPNGILGSTQTKHGEVAEHIEVNVRNAWDALKGQEKTATFEGVGRTAPEDFILNGTKYQSKFINGSNNTLSHVLDHFEKYKDGSIRYSIPKDQYEVIEHIRSGGLPEHLNSRSIQSILKKIKEIEQQTGKPFRDVVSPSISNYDEVQLGRAGETVSNYQEDIVNENQNIQDEIQEDGNKKRQKVQAKRGASLGEGLKVAGGAAAISASLNTITVIYSKVKKGKRIDEFNQSDWKEIGLSATKSGVQGGFTAGSIYALTNLTSLSAPFAGAVTSASAGLTSLLVDVKRNEISMDDFVAESQVICFEAGIAATGGAIGQMLIPIPVLGSIIGTLTADFVWEFAKNKLGTREKELKKILNEYVNSILEKIDQKYKEIIDKIKETYAPYDNLIEAAFDVHANSAVIAGASIKLAEKVGVEKSKIIYDDDDLDTFFLG